MLAFATTCMLITCLLAIYVGARTLSVWFTTRKVAELSIGLNVLGIALGGALLTAFKAPVAVAAGDLSARPILALTIVSLFVHVVALYVGNWRIFRPADRWPIPVIVLAVGLTAAWSASIWVSPAASNGRAILFEGLRAVGMAWAFTESFRYSAMLRKRVALGLASPMIAHRIQLWAVGAGCQVASSTLEIGHRSLTGVSIFASPLGLLSSVTCGLIGAVCIALAFFPPRSYERFVSERAAASATVS